MAFAAGKRVAYGVCNDEKDDENFGARAAVGLCVDELGDGTLTVHLDNVDR